MITKEIRHANTTGAIGSLAPELMPFEASLEPTPIDIMTIRDLFYLGGIGLDAPLAFILMRLFKALEEGSLCLDLEPQGVTRGLPRELVPRAIDYLAAFGEGHAAGEYGGLISDTADAYRPLIHEVYQGIPRLFFQKYHFHATGLKNKLSALLNAHRPPLDEGLVGAIIDELYQEPYVIRLGSDGQAPAIHRDPFQVAAIRLVLTSPFAIVSGGPGTGKTSLMVNILRALVRTGVTPERIVLGAPTGRAAQRMSEALHGNLASIRSPSATDHKLLALTGSTLHKILGYRTPSHDFHHGPTNPLDIEVLIVDEVSMVDVILLDKLLGAIDPHRTRVVFLGDKDQLPAVEAGAVLAEMIPEKGQGGVFADRFVILERGYRSDVNLMALARQVNLGHCPPAEGVPMPTALTRGGGDAWFRVPWRGSKAWQADLIAWADHQYLKTPLDQGRSYRELVLAAEHMPAETLVRDSKGRRLLTALFRGVVRAKILALVRQSIRGVTGINAIVGRFLAAQIDPHRVGEGPFFAGALVIVTRNDYARDLFNGDVGVVIRDANGGYQAYFQRVDNDGFVGFGMDFLPAWEPAFAMTVHKAQGSEFDQVLLVLPGDPDHRLLTREVVYTGITRAKQRLIIHGQEEELSAALKRRLRRSSGLMW